MDATRQTIQKKKSCPLRNSIQLPIKPLKGDLIWNFQRRSMLALTLALGECTTHHAWHEEKSLLFGVLVPIPLVPPPLRCIASSKWLHLSLSGVWKSFLKDDDLPRTYCMDYVASGVGKIIRRKMGTRRMIQTYQSRSYGETPWFGYTDTEDKHYVFIHAVVSVRVVPYV